MVLLIIFSEFNVLEALERRGYGSNLGSMG
jgi:hypothetical protein